MTDDKLVKRIHTCIPFELWERAKAKNVIWAKALTEGIHLELDENFEEKEAVEEVVEEVKKPKKATGVKPKEAVKIDEKECYTKEDLWTKEELEKGKAL